MKKSTLLFIFIYFILLAVIQPAFSATKERVFVSILPQKFFVQHISGEFLDVEVMVQPGANPATYEPKPSQMRKLSQSKAYFAIGVPFENVWLEKISGVNADMQIIHTDTGIPKRAMTNHDHDEHGESKKQHHDDTGLDPHIWLSPILAVKQVETISQALITLFPEKQQAFTENTKKLITQLEKLHNDLQHQLAGIAGKRFMVFHPSWGYFAETYNLEQIAMEQEGKSPKTAQLKEVISFAKNNNITAILAQSQFSVKSAEIVAKGIGGEVIVVDPLAYDYINNLYRVADQLTQIAK